MRAQGQVTAGRLGVGEHEAVSLAARFELPIHLHRARRPARLSHLQAVSLHRLARAGRPQPVVTGSGRPRPAHRMPAPEESRPPSSGLSSNAAPQLSDGESERFDRDGVVHVKSAFDQAWLDAVERVIAAALAAPGVRSWELSEGQSGLHFADEATYFRFPEVVAYVWRSPAASVAGQAMRARSVRYYSDTVFAREPGTLGPTIWHSDAPALAVTGSQQATVWMPVDIVPREVQLEFVVGSHRWAEAKPVRVVNGRIHADPAFRLVPNVNRRRREFEVVTFEVEPGDCLVFHSNIIHGAPGGHAGRRWAVATRWVGDDVRYHPTKPNSFTPLFAPRWLRDGMRPRGRRFPIVWTAEKGLRGQTRRPLLPGRWSVRAPDV